MFWIGFTSYFFFMLIAIRWEVVSLNIYFRKEGWLREGYIIDWEFVDPEIKKDERKENKGTPRILQLGTIGYS